MVPVFAFEWLAATRRWQGYALWSLFVLSILSALVITWTSRREVLDATTIRSLARVREVFYITTVGTQLTLVLLVAPATTFGATCLDRSRGTLAHPMVTDLSDREIVTDKLAARLVPVLGLVGCTLPVVAFLTLLGGVDPEAIHGAFSVAACLHARAGPALEIASISPDLVCYAGVCPRGNGRLPGPSVGPAATGMAREREHSWRC